MNFWSCKCHFAVTDEDPLDRNILSTNAAATSSKILFYHFAFVLVIKSLRAGSIGVRYSLFIVNFWCHQHSLTNPITQSLLPIHSIIFQIQVGVIDWPKLFDKFPVTKSLVQSEGMYTHTHTTKQIHITSFFVLLLCEKSLLTVYWVPNHLNMWLCSPLWLSVTC